jgi:hypothetical protein
MRRASLAVEKAELLELAISAGSGDKVATE